MTTISIKTHKMLWGRAANRCAFPDCRQELVMDSSDTDDEALIGEEAHIIAKDQNGPRGEYNLPLNKRNRYSNLILLCANHHTLIDKQPSTYTVELLHEFKKTHETWVHKSLQGFDAAKQKDDEHYADIVDEWIQRAKINYWMQWSSWVLASDQPTIVEEEYDEFINVSNWIYSRIWPKRYPELEAAFDNFRNIINDFKEVFLIHGFVEYPNGSEGIRVLQTSKSYKNDRLPAQTREDLFKQYYDILDLLGDLMLELTRAANYICDNVRLCIDKSFRLKEGVVLAIKFNGRPQRTEYKPEERSLYPYPGLEQFKIDRKNRDLCCPHD